MKKSTALNRKTSRMIAKNLIILLVLAVVAFIAIWAWFTRNSSAEANGINVVARAEGVEVSWDDKDYYYNLTALTKDDVEKGKTGLAKNISGKEGVPSSLKLITGNGLDFFEPYLNRRLGTPLLNSDNTWQGINIENGEGKYIDLDLYFRSSTARDIYLAGDSSVSPKDADDSDRFSEYGDFSKDYICAASRVAFLNANKDKCSFIWAPNSNYELKESQDGYTRVTDVKEDEDSGGSGVGGNLNGGATEDGNDYYFWTIRGDMVLTASEQAQSVNNLQCTKFIFNSEINYYVTNVSFYIPKYSNNPSIPILINNSSDKSSLNGTDTANIKGAASQAISKEEQKFYIRNTDWQMNTDSGQFNCANVMNGNDQYIKSGEYMTLMLGYNPQTDILTVLKYNTSGGQSFDIGLDEGDPVYVKYYEINNDVNTALVSPEAGTAISSGKTLGTAVIFKDSSKKNVIPLSITTSEQFTAKKTGEGAEATYRFVNVKSDEYLYVSSSGKVSLSTSHSDFALAYVEGFTGPALKSGSYYIIMLNGEYKGVTYETLQSNDLINNLVTVYTGNSYTLELSSTANQDYKYYPSGSKTGEVLLNESTTPPLFATATTTKESVKVGNTKIVTLAKEKEDSEYYTAHIVIRIWVEGTDRDALTPLADGIFDTSLHFVSQ